MRTEQSLSFEHVHTADCLADCELVGAPLPETARTRLAKRRETLAVIAAVLAIGAGSVVFDRVTDGSPAPREPVAQQPAAPPAAPALEEPQGPLNDPQQAVVDALADKPVPDVTGLPLEKAYEDLLKVGLKPDADDATGQGRSVFNPLNWTVVRQDPAPGTPRAPGTEVTLYVVKDGEQSR